MILATAQYRYSGEDRFDTTFGAFQKGTLSPLEKLFVPNGHLVYGHKAFHGDERFTSYAPVSDEEYINRYKAMLRAKYVHFHDHFMDVFEHESLTLVCFCGAGKFCHRHILAEVFVAVANKHEIEMEFIGERSL